MTQTISFFIIFLLSCHSVYAISSSRYIQITHVYEIQPTAATEKVELLIPIPVDIPNYQVIHDIQKVPGNARTTYENGTRYFLYEWTPTKRFSRIEITIDLEILHYDWSVASQSVTSGALKKSQLKRFTKCLGLYRLTDFSMPDSITQLSSVEEKVRSIHSFVENSLEYHTAFGEDLGANKALNTGKGDCTEYADLMVALCRTQNIPARRVSGFTIKEGNNIVNQIFKSSNHAWLEVFFEKYGWIPFDPTHSDGSSLTTFDNLQNKYIYFQIDNPNGGERWRSWGGRVTLDNDRSWREYETLEDLLRE